MSSEHIFDFYLEYIKDIINYNNSINQLEDVCLKTI